MVAEGSDAVAAMKPRGRISWRYVTAALRNQNRSADACCSQANLLFALCASVFLSGCLTSVLAPILPARLDELHCPTFLRGAVFGAYPATVAVVSLFVPQLIDRFGRTPLLVLGLGAEGVLVMLFGVVRVHSPAHPAHGDAATVYVMLLLRILTVRSLARRRVSSRFQPLNQPYMRTNRAHALPPPRASARLCRIRCCCCSRRTSSRSRAAWPL